MQIEIKRADPTYEDISQAFWTGETHPYANFSREAREVIFCRERELAMALAKLSRKSKGSK